MSLARTSLVRPESVTAAAREAERDILLWTTRDGREIPLEDMTDDHIANAIRVLTLWRARLKKQGSDDPIIKDLAAAVTRFKDIQRRRRKSAPKDAAQSSSPSRFGRSSFARPRKPVAST
jgi:hypothetical protein